MIIFKIMLEKNIKPKRILSQLFQQTIVNKSLLQFH